MSIIARERTQSCLNGSPRTFPTGIHMTNGRRYCSFEYRCRTVQTFVWWCPGESRSSCRLCMSLKNTYKIFNWLNIAARMFLNRSSSLLLTSFGTKQAVIAWVGLSIGGVAPFLPRHRHDDRQKNYFSYLYVVIRGTFCRISPTNIQLNPFFFRFYRSLIRLLVKKKFMVNLNPACKDLASFLTRNHVSCAFNFRLL